MIDWGALHGYEFVLSLLIAALCIVLLLLFRKRRSAFEEYLSIAPEDSPNQVAFGIEVTQETVSSKARALWPGGEGEEVLAELGEGPENMRVKLAAIWLSNGSLDELKRWVGIGKVESRDVLVSAECPPEIWSDRISGADLDVEVGRRRSEHARRYRAWLMDEDQGVRVGR